MATVTATVDDNTEERDTLAWIDTHVPRDRRYYYYLRAYDDAGNQSDYSSMMDYKLIGKVSTSKLLASDQKMFLGTRPHPHP